MTDACVTLPLPLLVRWRAREDTSRDLRAGSTRLVVELARAAGASSIFWVAPVRLERRSVEALAGEFGELGGPGVQDELVSWVDAVLLAQLVLRLLAVGVESVPARTLRRVSDLGRVLVSGLQFPVVRDDTVFQVLLRERRLGERAFVLKQWLGSQMDGCVRRGEVTAPLRVASADQRHATPLGATMCVEASLYGFLVLWSLESLAHPGALRVCRSCGHVFEVRHGRQMHCSDACKMRAYRARAKGGV